MAEITGATNTQKTVILSLAEGWMLRYVDLHGWCLFMPNRARPFARVKRRTVDEMTAKGWLTPGIATKGLGYRPAKELTPAGRKYAARLQGKDWANHEEWDPLDQRPVKKGPKSPRESSSIIVEPNLQSPSPLRSNESIERSHCSDAPSSDESGQSSDAIPLTQPNDDADDQPRFRLVA